MLLVEKSGNRNVVMAEGKETWWKETSARAEGHGRERDDRRECHSGKRDAKAIAEEGNVWWKGMSRQKGGGGREGNRDQDGRDGNVVMAEGK